MKALNEFLNESLSDSEYDKIKKHLRKKDREYLLKMCTIWFEEDANFQSFKYDLDYEELFDLATTYIQDYAIDLKTIKSDFG
tara:strand:- start:7 stop:252 length:246 start_codon:yes stop_codon:yes gene_type:complete